MSISYVRLPFVHAPRMIVIYFWLAMMSRWFAWTQKIEFMLVPEMAWIFLRGCYIRQIYTNIFDPCIHLCYVGRLRAFRNNCRCFVCAYSCYMKIDGVLFCSSKQLSPWNKIFTGVSDLMEPLFDLLHSISCTATKSWIYKERLQRWKMKTTC